MRWQRLELVNSILPNLAVGAMVMENIIVVYSKDIHSDEVRSTLVSIIKMSIALYHL